MSEAWGRYSAAEITAALHGKEPNLHTLDLPIGGLLIRVHSNSRALLDGLDRYYLTFRSESRATPDFVVSAFEREAVSLPLSYHEWPREPGKSGRKEEWADVEGGRIVRKVRTGMLFLIGLDHRVAFGPCERNANQVINFVNTQLINHQLQRGAILGHAAAVATKDGEGAVAIAACSGGGKSTLSLGLLARGGNFVSNDRVLLHRVGDEVQVFGVPKLPRINPGTILHNPRLGALLSAERRKELSSWSREDLWKLEEKYDVDLALCFPESRCVHGAPLRALVVLDWDRRVPGPPRLTETRFEESEAAFRGLRKGPGPFYVPAAGELPNEPLEPDPAQYGEILSGLPTIEVTGGVDFESVAEEVAARLSLDRELEP